MKKQHKQDHTALKVRSQRLQKAELSHSDAQLFASVNVLRDSGNLKQAEIVLRDLLMRNPRHGQIINCFAVILAELGNTEESIKAFQQAISIDPSAEAYYNLGYALQVKGENAKALEQYDKAILLKPDYAEAHSNCGKALRDLGQYRAALDSYEKAIELAPNYFNANFGASMLNLLFGEYEKGWKRYEWRWKSDELKGVKAFPASLLWLGKQPLTGKTIVLHAEQGFGDTIQFCRYAPLVENLGAKVILQVPSPLVGLLATLKGSMQILAEGTPLPDYDYHCPLMSLPHAFGTTLETIPPAPYLHAQPDFIEKWRPILNDKLGNSKFRIGLCWAGGIRPNHPEAMSVDARRSLRFSKFKSLLDIPGAAFISLQLGPPKEELDDVRVLDISSQIRSWSDTAAIVSLLDLMITVDTSVCHLSGAIGQKTFLLNRYDTCWRWLWEREDSPWYPSLTQFRQKIPGNWENVIKDVKLALNDLVHRSVAPSGISFSEMLAKALDLHQAGNLDAAEPIYRTLLAFDPYNADALSLLGTLYAQRGNLEEAIQWQDKAIVVNPAYAEAYYNRGMALQMLGRLQEAVESYDRALLINPNYNEARHNRALITSAIT